MEAEYVMDVLRRDRAAEQRFFCRSGWKSTVPRQFDGARYTLLEWLCDIRAPYKLSRRTVLLAVSMLDRYLARRQTPRNKLQLVGACTLLIASKVEEVEALNLNTVVELCVGDHTEEDAKLCEHTIMNTLDFAVEGPTVTEFLPILICACQAIFLLGGDSGIPAQNLLRYGGKPSPLEQRRNETAWSLAEKALLDAEVSRTFPPSQVAAASMLLSNRLHGCRLAWSRALVDLSGYDAFALSTCVRALEALWRRESFGASASSCQRMR
jgi:hypothetical protein